MEFAHIAQETRSPILLNDKHPFSKLLILNIHQSNKHISAKYILNEFRQKFWLLCGRRIVRSIIIACVTSRKRHCKSYRYPPSPPLTSLRLNNLRPFFTVGIDNVGPVFVRNIYLVEDDIMHKALVTLYKCTASRAICIDLVPNMNSGSFIRSFRRFVSGYGCPDNVILDNGSDFVSDDSRNFVASRFIEWYLNLPLTPWYGGFFERLVKSVKDLLIKDLKGSRLSYKDMQTELFEWEVILNNRPLTYIYPTNLTSYLTPNHLLYGRAIQSSSIQSSPLTHDPFELTTQALFH